MLIEDVERVVAKISELERKREIAKSIQGFQVRAQMLERPLMLLKPLSIVLTEFQQYGITVDLQECSPTAQLLKGHASQVEINFEANPESILESDEQLRHQFWELLDVKNFPSTIKSILLGTWQKYVDALIPPQKTDLLDTLALVPVLRSDAGKIRQLYTEVSERRQRLPQSTSDFERLQAIPYELANLWQRFGGDIIPGEVLNFLRSASSQNGARLDQLTPTVLDWLREHNLERSIRIVF
jgi:hypothetical protein